MSERTFDVVIAGAGVIGCSIAYSLARAARGRLKIAVVEKRTPGGEASSGAAGMLAAQIEADSDGPFLRLALESRALFADLASELKEISGVDIEYEPSGIAALACGTQEAKGLRERLDWQTKAGLDCAWLSAEETARQFPFFSDKQLSGLWAPRDGQVSANRLTSAFYWGAKKSGVTFFEQESALPPAPGFTVLKALKTSRRTFSAGQFVFAAGPWMGELLPGAAPVGPVKGQILIFERPEHYRAWKTPVYLGQISDRDPIHCYLVPKRDGHLLLGATSESKGFDASENKEASRLMMDYVGRIFPDLAGFPLKGAWVGFRPAAPDREPLLGAVPGSSNAYVAGGHFRNGILLSAATGRLFADILMGGRVPESLRPFSPERFLQRASAQ